MDEGPRGFHVVRGAAADPVGVDGHDAVEAAVAGLRGQPRAHDGDRRVTGGRQPVARGIPSLRAAGGHGVGIGAGREAALVAAVDLVALGPRALGGLTPVKGDRPGLPIGDQLQVPGHARCARREAPDLAPGPPQAAGVARPHAPVAGLARVEEPLEGDLPVGLSGRRGPGGELLEHRRQGPAHVGVAGELEMVVRGLRHRLPAEPDLRARHLAPRRRMKGARRSRGRRQVVPLLPGVREAHPARARGLVGVDDLVRPHLEGRQGQGRHLQVGLDLQGGDAAVRNRAAAGGTRSTPSAAGNRRRGRVPRPRGHRPGASSRPGPRGPSPDARRRSRAPAGRARGPTTNT